MEIKQADFVISSADFKKCPAHNLPEYAFIGRSNVGKSSLINMLTRRKGLAKTSAKPGKTILINHFLINKDWYMVDLPGYGYAKLTKPEQAKLKRLIEGYILSRKELTCLFLLIDSRHKPLEVDINFMHFLGTNGIPFAIIFTKLDKLSAKQWSENFEGYKTRLHDFWEELPPIMVTSSDKGTGRDEVLSYIDSINQSIKEAAKAQAKKEVSVIEKMAASADDVELSVAREHELDQVLDDFENGDKEGE